MPLRWSPIELGQLCKGYHLTVGLLPRMPWLKPEQRSSAIGNKKNLVQRLSNERRPWDVEARHMFCHWNIIVFPVPFEAEILKISQRASWFSSSILIRIYYILSVIYEQESLIHGWEELNLWIIFDDCYLIYWFFTILFMAKLPRHLLFIILLWIRYLQ